MHQHALYDRPNKPQGWSDALLPHFNFSRFTIGNLNIPNPQLKFGKFWHVTTIQRFLSYTQNHQNKFFEAFHISQKLVSQGHYWTSCKFSVSLCLPFHRVTTITEDIQHKHTWMLKAVTLTTLIDSKLSQQYLAAYRCITAVCAQSSNFWLKSCNVMNHKNMVSSIVSQLPP